MAYQYPFKEVNEEAKRTVWEKGERCLSSKLSPKLNLFFCSNFL